MKCIKHITLGLVFLFSYMGTTLAQKSSGDFYQMRVYHMKSDSQVIRVDQYLSHALLPALHRLGIRPVGVFKPIANDTAADKRIYVLLPFRSADQWNGLEDKLVLNGTYQAAAKDFIAAPYDQAPFDRMESILINAFSAHKRLTVPGKKNPERVFELRSYESPTFHLAERKQHMFNHGGEIGIFNRLKFDPVFYGEVASGSRMPNLMYMPIFDNVEARNAAWKVFGNDPKWKEISTDPVNENKVSVDHIDSILMHSTSYSDY
ncbi:MAG: NIPSNAP family protein [Bacteroidota bacterium]|nr:NIPSNAP family protein [Bacteroidota bacterium]